MHLTDVKMGMPSPCRKRAFRVYSDLFNLDNPREIMRYVNTGRAVLMAKCLAVRLPPSSGPHHTQSVRYNEIWWEQGPNDQPLT